MRIAFHHIGLLTTKIDESLRFYTSLLGMQIHTHISTVSTSEVYSLNDGSTTTRVFLHLIGSPFSSWMKTFLAKHGSMLAFLGFEVDELDTWQRKFSEGNFEFLTPIEEIGNERQFYLCDPGGVVIKIFSQAIPFSSPDGSTFGSEVTSKYRLSHTNITCSEISFLENFYINKLDMTIVLDRRDEGMIFLADPEAISDDDLDIFPLELFGPPGLGEPDIEFLEKHGAGLQYLCFAVDDVDSAYHELSSLGVEFHLKPTDFENNRVAFFKDPNGIDIEILHPLPQSILRG